MLHSESVKVLPLCIFESLTLLSPEFTIPGLCVFVSFICFVVQEIKLFNRISYVLSTSLVTVVHMEDFVVKQNANLSSGLCVYKEMYLVYLVYHKCPQGMMRLLKLFTNTACIACPLDLKSF